MDITLSIVMPVFNHPQELKVMMDSILANSFADWELIAVDDGSDESTLSMLADYASNDNRIHFVSRNRNPKGAQICRNMGLEMARGKYVVFFDSDDYVAPYCLQQRVELMEEKQELDFMVFPSGSMSLVIKFTEMTYRHLFAEHFPSQYGQIFIVQSLSEKKN